MMRRDAPNPFLATLKVFVIWVSLGMALGLKPFLDHMDNAGGEALVFLAMGLTLGIVGGLIFTVLYRAQLRHGAPTRLQAVLTGVAAASVFVVINGVQAMFLGGTAGTNSDIVACALVLITGGVAGLLADVVTRSRVNGS